MRTAWARSVAAGVADLVFWGSTPVEVVALRSELEDARARTEKAANRRASLIAATVANFSGKRATKQIHPDDFWEDEGKRQAQDTPDALRSELLEFASRVGAAIA